MEWRLHWLEASGDLTPVRPIVQRAVEDCHARIAALVAPQPLDILVQRSLRTIPELGLVGHASGPALCTLSLDPGNVNFRQAVASGALERQVAHEAHHCLRMRAVGHGRTLGEALVSEGLAGRFVERVYGSRPEPWERALPIADLAQWGPSPHEIVSTDYDHDAWFFGVGAKPRWLGYTLGYEIVGRWQERKSPSVSTLVSASAAEVLAAGAP